MRLPDSWVDALFAKLAVRYGAAFMRQWPDADIAVLKADWAEVLGGFQNRPEAIRYGLEHLNPEKPPTAMQFRALCNAGPRDDGFLKLPPPGPAQEGPQLQAVREKLAEVRRKLTGFGTAQQEQLAKPKAHSMIDRRVGAEA